MATVQMAGPKFTITGSNVYKLGGSSNESDAGGVLVHIVNDGTLSATITVQGQSRQLEIAKDADAPLAIPYRAINVNGVAGTGAYVTTAITTNSIIFVPSNGMDVILSVAWVSGSASVYTVAASGSCAF